MSGKNLLHQMHHTLELVDIGVFGIKLENVAEQIYDLGSLWLGKVDTHAFFDDLKEILSLDKFKLNFLLFAFHQLLILLS